MYRSTIVIGIGHYRQNTVATASKSSGIKSLDIIDKRGIDIYSITAKENPNKTGKVKNYGILEA